MGLSASEPLLPGGGKPRRNARAFLAIAAVRLYPLSVRAMRVPRGSRGPEGNTALSGSHLPVCMLHLHEAGSASVRVPDIACDFCLSALAAVAVVAAVAFQTPTGRPIAAVSRAFSRTHNARVKYMSAAEQPVVYYYLPEKAASKVTHAKVAMLNETDANATSAEGAGDDSKFVCTLANIKALSAKVQSEWDKCKAADDYVEPNKDARRRLLGWVWEPDQEPKTAMPQHPPTYYKLRLSEADRRKSRVMHRAAMLDEQMLDAAADNATNATNATATGSEKNLLADCEHKALGSACESIASCANPVCESYYNDPEVEALCGMCTMGAGCFAHAAEVYTKDKGPVQISELTVGDKVLAATAEGSVVSSEVIFMHEHKDSSTTVRVEVAGNVMELTPAHMVATYTPACAGAYCAAAKLLPAREVRVGDHIYVTDGDSTIVKAVTGVSSAVSKVHMQSWFCVFICDHHAAV